MEYKIDRRALLAAAPAGLAGALGILAAGRHWLRSQSS